MKRPLKRGILGASTIIISKDIDKYAFMCGSSFYETSSVQKKTQTSVHCVKINPPKNENLITNHFSGPISSWINMTIFSTGYPKDRPLKRKSKVDVPKSVSKEFGIGIKLL